MIEPSSRVERSEVAGSRHVSLRVSPRDRFRGAGFQPVDQTGVSPAFVSTGVTPVCPTAEDGCAALFRLTINSYACPC